MQKSKLKFKIQKSAVIPAEAGIQSMSLNKLDSRRSLPSATIGGGNDTSNDDKIVKSAGFVLFFSLLVSSIILAAGLAVSRIVVRQILLASVQKDSQMALFAADAGIECARYLKANYLTVIATPTCNGSNDLKNQMLNFDKKTRTFPPPPPPVPVSFSTDVGNGFWFNIGDDPNNYTSCVKIGFGEKRVAGVLYLEINAYGYNVSCDPSGNPEGGRVVERGLRFTYQ